MEFLGVANGCGEQEEGVASGSGWNLRVWLVGVVVRRYIDFIILLIPHVCSFLQQHPYFLIIFINVFHSLDNIHGTGLETCHVSALNACKMKWPLHVMGICTSQVSERCCLYMNNHVYKHYVE